MACHYKRREPNGTDIVGKACSRNHKERMVDVEVLEGMERGVRAVQGDKP